MDKRQKRSRAAPLSLIVVGGGAAGFFAATRARELNSDLAVTLLESAPRALGKVRISGGGRCNVTHACYDIGTLVTSYPRGQKELRTLLTRFMPQETVQWFEQRGVRLKTEGDGRIFPISDDSETICSCLEEQAAAAGVEVRLKCPVRSVKPKDGGYQVGTSHGLLDADFVLLACGGSRWAWQAAKDLGHSPVPPVPSLFTFNIRDERLEGLAGVSVPLVRGRLEVEGQTAVVQEGPLLVTHWGLSGPVILRLSAWGARLLHASDYSGSVRIDFLPAESQESLGEKLRRQKAATPRKHVENEIPVELARRLWSRLAAASGISPEQEWGHTREAALNRLSEGLKRSTFKISGKGVFKEEFVTAGGIPLKEIDLRTMESRRNPGLYFAGEIIDVDGLTGGFNFQNAWATGWIAGEAVARRSHP